MTEGYDIQVVLYPPAGAGMQVVGTPQGPVQQIMFGMQYDRVLDLKIDFWPDSGNFRIQFTLRNGDKIDSNLPYHIRYTKKPDTDN